MPLHPRQDFDIEFSPLSQDVTRNGMTVRVNVYRIPGVNEGWVLETVDQDQFSTASAILFETDVEAFETLMQFWEPRGEGRLRVAIH